MRRRSCLFLLVASCLPVFLNSPVAHAIPYTLEYSGQLTDRRTPGYDYENFVSGRLRFDVAYATNRVPDDVYHSKYVINSGAQDFGTRYVAPSTSLSNDFLLFNNSFGGPNNTEPTNDRFNIYDSSVLDGVRSALFVAVEPSELDWLFSDQVAAFEFGPDQLTTPRSSVVQTQDYFTIFSKPLNKTKLISFQQIDKDTDDLGRKY